MAESPVLHLHGQIVLDDDLVVGDAWVEEGVLLLDRPASACRGATRVEGWAFPGLVDAHCHIGLGPEGPVEAARAAAQAISDRDSGVLAIRDAGSPSDTRWVHARPDLPRLMRCGQHLARPKRYLRGYARELSADSDLPAAMAEEARRGDGWVKIVGDWIDRDLGPGGDLRPLWSREALTAGMAAAHAESARVTVHTFSSEAIDDLLDAGVDGIEHGTGVGEEHLSTMADRGIPVTPTLLQIGQFAAIAAQADGKYPIFAARMRRLHERRYAQVRMLREAGVPLLVGTDAGGTIVHGRLADECAELVRAGVPAAEVVAAASWRGRRIIGLPAVAAGSAADLVLYTVDPRVSIRSLAVPSAVVLRGQLVPRA